MGRKKLSPRHGELVSSWRGAYQIVSDGRYYGAPSPVLRKLNVAGDGFTGESDSLRDGFNYHRCPVVFVVPSNGNAATTWGVDHTKAKKHPEKVHAPAEPPREEFDFTSEPFFHPDDEVRWMGAWTDAREVLFRRYYPRDVDVACAIVLTSETEMAVDSWGRVHLLASNPVTVTHDGYRLTIWTSHPDATLKVAHAFMRRFFMFVDTPYLPEEAV